MERARPDEFQRRLGERLRIREEQRLTMKAVEVLSHRRFKPVTLAGFERPDRPLTVDRSGPARRGRAVTAARTTSSLKHVGVWTDAWRWPVMTKPAGAPTGRLLPFAASQLAPTAARRW